MKWFRRWTVAAAVLVGITVVVWWFVFEDQRPAHFWIVLLSTGLGSVFVGGLMAMGSTEAVEESDQVFPFSSYKSQGLKGADVEQHGRNRLIQGLEASPAIWGFVIVGALTMLISVGVRSLV